MKNTSFWMMRDSAFEVYKSMNVLLDEFDWEVFSEEGAIRCEAYEILTDAFKRCDSKVDLAAIVAGEINNLWYDMREERRKGAPENLEEAEHLSQIARYLIRYMIYNCEEECLEDHAEYGRYNNDHEEWGW